MSKAYSLGIVVGFIVGIMIVMVLVRFCRGKWSLRCRSEYDERQKEAIGRAYKQAFWTMVIGMISLFVLVQMKVTLPDLDLCMITVTFIGLGVYVLGCIMRDAYYGIHDNAKRWAIAIGFIGGFNFWIGYMNIARSGLRYGVVNLECGILMLTVLIGIGIRKLMIQKSEEE